MPVLPDGPDGMVKGFGCRVSAARAELAQPVVELAGDPGSYPVVRPPQGADHMPEASDLQCRGQMVCLVDHVHGSFRGRAGRKKGKFRILCGTPAQTLDAKRPIVQVQ